MNEKKELILKLKFEKLKTEWEHHRATIFNYTLGLITIIIFGGKYFILDNSNHCLRIIFFMIVIFLSLGAIIVIINRMIKIREIQKRMDKMIKHFKRDIK